MYREFIRKEHEAEKSIAGSKVQLAEVFHEFVKHACSVAPVEEAKSNIVSMSSRDEAFESIMEQYSLFFHAEQNKEVLAMALSTVPGLMAAFQNPLENNIDESAANMFEQKFKRHFMTLEKNLQNNWRLHVHYI